MAQAQCLEKIDVVILAGGLGTRLASALPDTPKILAPVGGRPFLTGLTQQLRRFGARRLVLGLGHLAEKVLDHLESFPPEGLDVVTVIEPEPLGTAGAIKYLRHEIRSDPVMVMNGDSYVDADLCDFVAAHAACGAEASLIAARVENAGRFGSLDLSADGWIVAFREKAGHAGPQFINAGIYLFGASMIERIDAMQGSSLERDVFQVLAPKSIHAMAGDFTFLDIGTPEDLARAGDVLSPTMMMDGSA